MTVIIDSDQHLYESRTLWAQHIDPAFSDEALAIVDDELGYPWLTWRGQRLDMADVQFPGDTAVLGRYRQRCRDHLPPEYRYDEELPAHYWDPSSRADISTSWASTRPWSSPISGCSGSAGCRRHCPR